MTSATSPASVTSSGSGAPPGTERAAQSGFALGLPPRPALLSRPAWIALIALIIAIGLGVPFSALVLPETSAFHLSAYMMTLTGKFMCYAIGALALDLVWGYCGILSLGHALFFALGGYAIGMYLMRAIGHNGVYQSDLPDFMVFLNWHALPWYWEGTQHLWYALLLVILVPAVIAWVFGFFTFRSRVKGVYLSIITQAMTFAAMLLFYRNETGFGARAIVTSKLGRVVTAVRDGETRLMFLGYSPLGYKLFIWTVSAILCGIAGALYVPQVGIINPGEMSPGNSIEMAIWVAVGGRGTLIGPIIGAFAVNGAKSFFTANFPEYWLFFLGLIFVLVPLLLPRGIMGLIELVLHKRDRS
jgi:urea transport system permease protein